MLLIIAVDGNGVWQTVRAERFLKCEDIMKMHTHFRIKSMRRMNVGTYRNIYALSERVKLGYGVMCVCVCVDLLVFMQFISVALVG